MKEKSKKTNTNVKPFINTGLFTLLLMFGIGMGGLVSMIPVLMPVVPFVSAFFAAPVFMLYTTKIKNYGMLTVSALLLSIFFTLTGHGWYIIPVSIISATAAELILRKGKYASIKASFWSCLVFFSFVCFNMLPIFINREEYAKSVLKAGYSQDFFNKMSAALPQWIFPVLVVLGIIGAMAGAAVGIKLLKKHFIKANMV